LADQLALARPHAKAPCRINCPQDIGIAQAKRIDNANL
jgi:hypothetical protein